MTDLLPPSPSAISPSSRFFSPSPSSLSINTESYTPYYLSSNSGTYFNQSPSITLSTSPTSSKSVTQVAIDSPSTMSPRWGSGPPIRPLDYCQLLSSEDLHTELQRTVDDLASWLALVDQGLSAMLDTPSQYRSGSLESGSGSGSMGDEADFELVLPPPTSRTT
jgi:protein-serine/threonine kinase